VGVRFKGACPIHYYDTADLELELGQAVVGETEDGPRLGWVVVPPQLRAAEPEEPPKPLLRLATEEDLAERQRLEERAQATLEAARHHIARLSLGMKPLVADYAIDGRQVTVSFTSEARADFRDLVRDLSREVGARVHMRQVGPRDAAKVTGGIGICGRPLCCATWLTSFPTVTIGLAKEQNLLPLPEKLSGLCGRLRCCLRYESPVYKELKANLPKRGQTFACPAGCGRVVGVNVIKQTVYLEMESRATVEVAVSDLAEPPQVPVHAILQALDLAGQLLVLEEHGRVGEVDHQLGGILRLDEEVLDALRLVIHGRSPRILP